MSGWKCTSCTFLNPASATQCGACAQGHGLHDSTVGALHLAHEGGGPGRSGMGAGAGAGAGAGVGERRANGRPKNAQEERAEAVEQFGFDIYGTRSDATGTLGHLT